MLTDAHAVADTLPLGPRHDLHIAWQPTGPAQFRLSPWACGSRSYGRRWPGPSSCPCWLWRPTSGHHTAHTTRCVTAGARHAQIARLPTRHAVLVDGSLQDRAAQSSQQVAAKSQQQPAPDPRFRNISASAMRKSRIRLGHSTGVGYHPPWSAPGPPHHQPRH